MKTLLTLTLMIALTAFVSHSQQTTTSLFAQCMFDIQDQGEMQALQNEMNANPYVEMVRLDYHTQRALILTHDLSQLTEEEFKTWFGTHANTVYCVQIGVRGTDTMNPYPFQNCQ
tara:strand:- start:3112 stop:3456 length:345 start_codon:yes stop_codon:yes gene_type:complete